MVRPGCALVAGLFIAALPVHSRAGATDDPTSQPATQATSAATSQPVAEVAVEAPSQPASTDALPPAALRQLQVTPAVAEPAGKTVRWSGTRDRVYKIFVSAGSVAGGLCLPCLGCAGTAFVASPELTMFSFALAPQLGMVLGATASALFFGDPVRALSAGVVAALVGGAVSVAGFGALALLASGVADLTVQGAAGYAWIATPLLASAATLTAFHVAYLWLLDRTPLQPLLAGRLATDEQESNASGATSSPAER